MEDPLNFAHLGNLQMIEENFERYRQDPESVDPSWRHFFQGMQFADAHGPQMAPGCVEDVRISHLIDAYRTYGHLFANVNPVATTPPTLPHELDLGTLGFEQSELKMEVPTFGLRSEARAPLEELIERLQEIYCREIGIEYMHCQSPELRKWVQEQIEPTSLRPSFDATKKKEILEQLNHAELFEIFLHTKYVGQKRFSLEGGETLIPILHELVEVGSTLEMDEFVIGMAHRGRLNVLTNIMKKSYSMVFSEFEDIYEPDAAGALGDVKYHKGFSSDIVTDNGHGVHISLAANPSHLESVNPVVEGRVRAKQVARHDGAHEQVVPILIHGDAAVAGQGVVYETMQLYGLPGYGTGGSIHIVVNNQIGFTTLPKDGRSTRYCTDLAKSFDAPILHVNGEDPEGCVYAADLAISLRRQFGCDVFIELNCYRKYGHNESDEPAFTQPLEYQLIRKKKSSREIYRDHLIHEGVVEKKIAEDLEAKFNKELHFELEEMKLKKEPRHAQAFGGVWKEYKAGMGQSLFDPVNTSVDLETLKEVAQAFCTVREGFNIHRKLEKLVQNRLAMIQEGRLLDWGMAEHMALASLLWEGTHVRLSGQDSRRGTFSQRHAMWVDQKTNEKYFPLSNLKSGQGRFDVFNSPLSEFAVLGFEFGYSLSFPSALVLWEAQFGDFANGGQVIIDQYICSSEQKWQRYSGLVMLLPHGYEGQGPEHSSARIERFLQLSGHSNMQVVYPTTPAQYFHLLRRQVLRLVRKPLVVFTPKGLLRHPKCVSGVEDLTRGTFQEILDDPKKPLQSKRLLFCSGRVYYDLLAEREKRGRDDVILLRIEQLYPLHLEKMRYILDQYKNVTEYLYVQEEPRNMGAWEMIHPTLRELIGPRGSLHFVGPSRSASPTVGSHSQFVKEHTRVIEMAFEGGTEL